MPVYIFLHDNYADWEIGHLLPELRSPPTDPRIPKQPREVVTFTLDGKQVVSYGGLRVVPDAALGAVAADTVDALILPGGTFWKDFDNADVDTLVREVRARGAILGAICAATGYLARLGLLDHADHTSNSVSFLSERAPGYAGGDHYRGGLAHRDGSLITASGLGAVDFTDLVLRALEVFPPAICDVWLRAFRYGEDPYG